MSLAIQQISYIHPDNETLFRDIHLIVNKGEKVALLGPNGCGKSTLLQIIRKEILPTEGEIISSSAPYYVPQHFGQYDTLSVAQALRIDRKLKALYAILAGDAAAEYFDQLDDDWSIEERSRAALSGWGLEHIAFDQPFASLSGGEKTKVFLAGLQIHTPEIILMDEPSNHLDAQSRQKLYQFISSSPATILVVSHDITLLNQLSFMVELGKEGITAYGGNYDFYKAQKQLQLEALQSSLEEKEKELRLAKKIARETAERKQKHEVRGKKQKEKSGVGKMAMDTLQDKAEKSASKLKDVHEEKNGQLQKGIEELRKALPDNRAMKVDFNASALHTGKILIKAEAIQFGYSEIPLFINPLSFTIRSGDRWVIKGNNGSGKTTLIKLITGQLSPTGGEIERADFTYLYIDQEYSLVRNELTVYEQAEQYNSRHFAEHEVKMLLSRYLFPYGSWDKPCAKLSGGEKMRLAFCCLMIGNQKPDMIILDEPTNNLDVQSIEVITAVIKEYKGTVVAVSHDGWFVGEIGVREVLELIKNS
ncbi:ABC-F family ATP-binding cassette domain-containing protein [Parabacteroides sp. PF5-6]|uniref:ABC-F family ATP-binding cassette domain-containing protein n=1 Tax=Parabacteroides sp. PF5-6 TaxID=1742403 RepID=UPI0024075041|nr:ABC-F family ATP-binding cassette domain-containing protein [Parabacteroides sp. PF5-6]MDF9830738.1 ATPase subunit of ABC transporter with duplicated ATPase domains [Parabacteroides sp. PF5-6]